MRNAEKNFIGQTSPWGIIQTSEVVSEGGIVRVHTAGHGGLKITEALNERIPDSVRSANGWYEEDCEWSIVATVYPELFPVRLAMSAISVCKNYFPEVFFEITGILVDESESSVLRLAAFKAKNAENYIAVSAVGSWHKNCPRGYVVCTAAIGGRNDDGSVGETQDFLVPEDDYRERADFFVIDPARHPRVVKESPEE